jgi:hypothetical protein
MDNALDAEKDRAAFAMIAGFFVARLIFAFSFGLGIDESYTLAISRRLQASYFDHPPLHLWIAHFAALAFGENVVARLPFVVLFAATGWLYYVLVFRLFGRRAALIALFALNASPFFFASAGSWIVPDGALLFALSLFALAASGLLSAGSRNEGGAWGSWLLIGLGLGLAGLSKYSAVLAALGFAAFFFLAPRQRLWIRRPAPYVSAALALALAAPVVVWNARHGWASFAFQGARGVYSGGWRPAQVLAVALGQIAYLSPWIFAPLVVALWASFRRPSDDRRTFLLRLGLPAIVLFTLTPLWGARGLPHWSMPGWFFTFALLGAWAAESGVADAALRRWAIVSSVLLALVVGVAAIQAQTGEPLAVLSGGRGIADPTLEAADWGELTGSELLRGAPAFVVSTKWSDAGKIAVALGPKVPVLVLSSDPRGWAFADDSSAFLGRDGVIVTRAAELPQTLAAARSYFKALGEPQLVTLGRMGRPEIRLAIIPASGLTLAFPSPYPNPAGW